MSTNQIQIKTKYHAYHEKKQLKNSSAVQSKTWLLVNIQEQEIFEIWTKIPQLQMVHLHSHPGIVC